jgi:hypothetical protein
MFEIVERAASSVFVDGLTMDLQRAIRRVRTPVPPPSPMLPSSSASNSSAFIGEQRHVR